MLKTVALTFLLVAGAFAQAGSRSTTSGRYIVGLNNPAAGVRVRAEVERHHGKIFDELTGPYKALVVETDEATLARIRKFPGVGLVKADKRIPRKPNPKTASPESRD